MRSGFRAQGSGFGVQKSEVRRWVVLSRESGDNRLCMGAELFMPSELATQPEWTGQQQHSPSDEAMDAVVVEVHPALLDLAEYPYGPRAIAAANSEPAQFWGRRPVSWLWHLRFEGPAPADYVVPQRFGMSAIIGIMTALAFLFGALRVVDADPVVYLFFGLQAVVICLVQMFNGRAPRLASSITGTILAPLFVVQLLDAADILPR